MAILLFSSAKLTTMFIMAVNPLGQFYKHLNKNYGTPIHMLRYVY
jgi:hypothetical protein